MTWSKY